MQNNNTKNVIETFKDYYLKEKFQESIDLLIKEKESFNKGVFHFNLGTVYLKLDKPAIARYHLEKAKKEGYNNEKLLTNLNTSITNLKVTSGLREKTTLEATKFFLVDQSYHFYSLLSLSLLLIPLLLLFLKKINVKKSIFLFIVSLIPILFFHQYIEQKNTAIVLEETQVREGPSQVFSQSHILPRGTKVITDEIKNDWVYIVYPISFVGWVKRSQLGVL